MPKLGPLSAHPDREYTLFHRLEQSLDLSSIAGITTGAWAKDRQIEVEHYGERVSTQRNLHRLSR
jgi:phenolic acid decarboxylase